MKCLDRITDSVGMNLSKLQVIVEERGAWRAAVHGVAELAHRGKHCGMRDSCGPSLEIKSTVLTYI